MSIITARYVTFSSPADDYLSAVAPNSAGVALRKNMGLVGSGRWLRGCITIVLDPMGFLTRLGGDHICDLRHGSTAAFIRVDAESEGEVGFDRN